MTMSFRTRTCVVLAGAATLALSTATTAAATEDPPQETTTEEAPVEWPPADTDGEWLPVPDELAQPIVLEACGSTVTGTTGDVMELEYQAMHQPDGTIRVEYRGESTLDIARESDGALLDELEAGGPGTEIYSADGQSIVFSWEGPSVIFAFDEVEAAVFAAQGLPSIFYYESGNTTERVVLSEDPQAPTIESAEFLTDTARGVRDVCDMLDLEGHEHH